MKQLLTMAMVLAVVLASLSVHGLQLQAGESEDSLNSNSLESMSVYTVPPQPGTILLLDEGGEPGQEGKRALDRFGYTYTHVSSAQFATVDLNSYDVIFVAWYPRQATVDALNARKAELTNYISSGGGIVVNAQWRPAVTNPYSFLPVAFDTASGGYHTDGVRIVDSTHPLMSGLTGGLLSPWWNSAHGRIAVWPSEATVVTEATAWNSPHILAMEYGAGRIVVAATDPEFHVVYGPGYGPWQLLYNQLNWACSGTPSQQWVKVRGTAVAYICNNSVDFRFTRNLASGSTGDDVKFLQILLNSNPLTRLANQGVGSPGNETTNYGPITQEAVKKFQQLCGLPPDGQDGIVAGDTLAALNTLVEQFAPVKTIPNGWVLRVINTHGNSKMEYGLTWWEVEDVTDRIRGWIAYRNNIDDATYLEEVPANIGQQRTQELSSGNARKSAIVTAVKNRTDLFLRLGTFPAQLMLAIIAGEMTHNADNTHISFDCGRGISQVTNPNTLVGQYSGVRCYGGSTKGFMPYEFVSPFDRSITKDYWTDRGCSEPGTWEGETTYRDCGCKEEPECEGKQEWYYGGTDTTGRCRYYPQYDDGCRVYTNTPQGIAANLKDGKGRLNEGYGTSISRHTGTERSFRFVTQLRIGDEGKEVAYLQYLLKLEIDQALRVTADFDPITETTLKAFQAREFAGEEPSGIVDLKTRNRLNTMLDIEYDYLRYRVEEIRSWLGGTWRYQGSYAYLIHVSQRVEGLDAYFPNHETQLGNDVLDEATWQFMLAAMKNYQHFNILSPVEFRIYDSQGYVTGVIQGQAYEDIPDSELDCDGKSALIILPSDVYVYEVVGTEEGAYGIEAASVQGGVAVTFAAIEIPISTGAIHRYIVDWDVLTQGGQGVTVHVDSDGDGEFDRTFTTDSDLTGDEFVLKTRTAVTIDPDTLNLQAPGRWITGYVELPADYAAADIDINTVQLIYNGNELHADWGDVQDGVFMAKFDWATVAGWFAGLHDVDVELTVAGEVDRIEFEGTATIRVIDPPRPRRGR